MKEIKFGDNKKRRNDERKEKRTKIWESGKVWLIEKDKNIVSNDVLLKGSKKKPTATTVC